MVIKLRGLSCCFLGGAGVIENPRVGGSIPSPATTGNEITSRACLGAGPSCFRGFIKFGRKFAARKVVVPARFASAGEALALLDPALDPPHALLDGSAGRGEHALAPLNHAGEPPSLWRDVTDAALVPVQVRAVGAADPVARRRQGSGGRNAHGVIVGQGVAARATTRRQGARHANETEAIPHEESVGGSEGGRAARGGGTLAGRVRACGALAPGAREDAGAGHDRPRAAPVRAAGRTVRPRERVAPAAPPSRAGPARLDDPMGKTGIARCRSQKAIPFSTWRESGDAAP
jgi:hypothetical protein